MRRRAVFHKFWQTEGRNRGSRETWLSLELRVFLLALDRARTNGHAELDPGELMMLCPKAGGGFYTQRRVNQAISDLRRAGLLAKHASARCLLVPMEVADLNLQKGKKCCATHGTDLAWSARSGAEGWHDLSALPRGRTLPSGEERERGPG